MSSSGKIVVLGGSGFVGSRLVGRLLQAGFEVLIGDKRPSPDWPHAWASCDVRSLDQLRSICQGASAIINLAAEHQDNVRPIELYDQVNVDGAKNICQIASEAGVPRIIFTSSVAVYGFMAHPAREEDPCNPFNDYGRTKLAAEKVFKEWVAGAASRSLVIIRPTVIFGTGNRGNVFNLLKQIARGRFLMIGNGRNRKSLAYVENVADFLVHAITLPPGEHLFNYADKPDFEMRELVSAVNRYLGRRPQGRLRLPYGVGLAGGAVLDVIARLTGRTFPISAIRVKKFCADTRISSERVSALGFKPAVSLAEALEKVVKTEFGNDHRANP